jgi:hypothetical protein
MKTTHNQKSLSIFLGLALTAMLLLGGCTNITPTEPTPSPTSPTSPSPTSPAKPVTDVTVVRVTYSYGATDKVQLSNNNLVLKVGQTLILEPAPGLTTNTRFTSSGENFFGTVMKQDATGQDNTKASFTAIAPGKGKLTIIPNTNDTARATDLWVTVQ